MDLATVDKLLTTTRSVRARLDLTRPVAPELIEECLDIAVQAPTGSNLCRYHFIVVTDAAKRGAVAELYRRAFAEFYPPERVAERGKTDPHDVASWTALAENFQDVPVLIVACVEGRPEGLPPERLAGLYGNILPAAWSLMLALRARGVGAAWTTIAFRYEREFAEILQLPENLTPGALLPIACFKGDDFKPAKRVPARERTHWNTWGTRRQKSCPGSGD
jgi:nitroreductase